MSLTATAFDVAGLLGALCWHWGKTGLEKPGGAASERVYTAAWKYGPVVGVVGVCLGLVLHLAGAP